MRTEEEFNNKMKEMGIDWDWKREQSAIKEIAPYQKKIKMIKSLLEKLIADDMLIDFYAHYNRGELLFNYEFNLGNLMSPEF